MAVLHAFWLVLSPILRYGWLRSCSTIASRWYCEAHSLAVNHKLVIYFVESAFEDAQHVLSHDCLTFANHPKVEQCVRVTGGFKTAPVEPSKHAKPSCSNCRLISLPCSFKYNYDPHIKYRFKSFSKTDDSEIRIAHDSNRNWSRLQHPPQTHSTHKYLPYQ